MKNPRLKKNASFENHRSVDDARPDRLIIAPHPGVMAFIKVLLVLSVAWIFVGLFRYAVAGSPSPLVLIVPSAVGLLYWWRFRTLNRQIVLSRTSNSVTIPDAVPLRLSDIKRLYVVRWDKHSAHRIIFHELNLETIDGRRENLLITPLKESFEAQAQQIAGWLGIPIHWPRSDEPL